MLPSLLRGSSRRKRVCGPRRACWASKSGPTRRPTGIRLRRRGVCLPSRAYGGEMDDTTTIAELRTLVEEFVHERDWEQFHRPKSLAMSIAIEAAELMELFQWPGDAEAERLIKESRTRRAATDELADVVIYCLAFANRTGIDLS